MLINNIYRTPVSGLFRRKDSGFAVCGENLASISRFVAGIRHGRQLRSRTKVDFGAAVTATGTMIGLGPGEITTALRSDDQD